MRLSGTIDRVDWSLAAYRGFKPVGLFAPVPRVGFVERFPRFTMVAGDFETIRGPWDVRGELAVFVEDHFPSPNGVGILRGHAVEGGLSVDRRAGNYRVGGSLLVRREAADRLVGSVLSTAPGISRPDRLRNTDVTLLGFAERRFARETRLVRAFAAYNASDAHAFVRTIGAISLRDNLWLEGAVGWFFGEGADVIGRFGDRDFLYSRLKLYF